MTVSNGGDQQPPEGSDGCLAGEGGPKAHFGEAHHSTTELHYIPLGGGVLDQWKYRSGGSLSENRHGEPKADAP